MAASHQHLAQHPQAPPHNRAPRAGHPDLELFPFLTDTFIDSLTARQAHQWAVLVMPDTVASTFRKNCKVEEKRTTLKFLRDLKRGGTMHDYTVLLPSVFVQNSTRFVSTAQCSGFEGVVVTSTSGEWTRNKTDVKCVVAFVRALVFLELDWMGQKKNDYYEARE